MIFLPDPLHFTPPVSGPLSTPMSGIPSHFGGFFLPKKLDQNHQIEILNMLYLRSNQKHEENAKIKKMQIVGTVPP